MKKSNALMLSYMIFLFVALLAKAILMWDGLDRIAVGATVAGCFFAVADLANWHLSSNTPLFEATKEAIEMLNLRYNAQKKSVRAKIEETERAIKIVQPYCGTDEIVDDIFVIYSDRVKRLEDVEQELQEESITDGLKELDADLERIKRKLAKYHIIDITFVVVGFVAFFSLVTFDAVYTFLEQYQTIATIVAFILIVLNYFLRDILDEKLKAEVEEELQEAEIERQAILRIEEEAKETPFLEQANKIEQLMDRRKSDENVKNALC